MRIHFLLLKNYRSHADLHIEFQEGFNVIAGLNGSGKTSILKAICDGLTGFTDFVPVKNSYYSALSEPSVARQTVNVSSGRYRFEENYPVNVSLTATAFGINFDWAVQKADQAARAQITGNSPGSIWTHRSQPHMLGGQLPLDIETFPVLAFYRANRHWQTSEANEMQAATERNTRIDGYESWADAAVDSRALQNWVIAKSLERFQTTSETGVLYDQIKDDELSLVNIALSNAVENIKGIKYDVKQKSLLVEWKNTSGKIKDPIPFANLSDGQRVVIGLVSDIARRMCLLNPHLGEAVCTKTPGIVLIDELDMHLHPKWQRLVTKGLKSAFPRVQFIVASHSPQVLGELMPSEIILLSDGNTSHPQVSYGLTSSQVLEQLMDAEPRASEVEIKISNLFENLERNNLSAAREDLHDLENQAPGIPEITGARALLKRKEVLGR